MNNLLVRGPQGMLMLREKCHKIWPLTRLFWCVIFNKSISKLNWFRCWQRPACKWELEGNGKRLKVIIITWKIAQDHAPWNFFCQSSNVIPLLWWQGERGTKLTHSTNPNSLPNIASKVKIPVTSELSSYILTIITMTNLTRLTVFDNGVLFGGKLHEKAVLAPAPTILIEIHVCMLSRWIEVHDHKPWWLWESQPWWKLGDQPTLQVAQVFHDTDNRIQTACRIIVLNKFDSTFYFMTNFTNCSLGFLYLALPSIVIQKNIPEEFFLSKFFQMHNKVRRHLSANDCLYQVGSSGNVYKCWGSRSHHRFAFINMTFDVYSGAGNWCSWSCQIMWHWASRQIWADNIQKPGIVFVT